MDDRRSRSALAAFLRGAAGLTAVSLLVYIPYRYVARPPGFDGVLGSLYAILFPLSLLLAVGALWVAIRPERLERLVSGGEGGGVGARWALGVYGGLWVAMGLMCVPSLTALAEVSPVKGLFSTVHMSAQHVFLGFGAVVTGWQPGPVRSWLEGRDLAPAGGAEAGPDWEPEPSRG